MKRIKEIVIDFTKAEVKAHEALKGSDLKNQHDTCDELYSYTDGLTDKLGIIKLEEMLGDDIFFNSDIPPTKKKTRFLYKISHYQSDDKSSTWVAYLSDKDPMKTYHRLSHAFFLQEIEGVPKIIKTFIYSNHESDGLVYVWSANEGAEGVTFESIGNVVEIERFMQPIDDLTVELYLKEA